MKSPLTIENQADPLPRNKNPNHLSEWKIGSWIQAPIRGVWWASTIALCKNLALPPVRVRGDGVRAPVATLEGSPERPEAVGEPGGRWLRAGNPSSDPNVPHFHH